MSSWPWWANGANRVGHYFGRDRVRCTECGKWAKVPVWYELERVLCGKCHSERRRLRDLHSTENHGAP